jgi:DNA modification methylase
VQGDNADLIANVARLYLRPHDVILDVTIGRAAFWKKVDLSAYRFFPTDIAMKPSVDLRKLPYNDNYADHLVLDPPYQHDGEDHVGAQYNARRTVRKMRHADIVNDLYGGGLREAWRVLKPCGLCWVKCCDQIEAGKQRRAHIEIFTMAQELGFEDVDLFILHRAAPPMLRQRRQLHARKNHSFLWILRKPSKSPK